MSAKKIYVALSTFAQSSHEPIELLKASGYRVEINQTGKRLDKAQVIAKVAGSSAVIAGLEPYDAEVLRALPGLQCISRCGVGVDNIDLKEAQHLKIKILNTPDAVVQPVAEMTLAMILDLLRKVSLHSSLMHRKQWEKHTGLQLAGKTIGVIGLGRIGRRVAELLIRLDCKVIAVDIKPDLVWARAHRVECVDLDQLLSVSDLITLHVTAIEGQVIRLSKKHFSMMKRGVMLVNTARGTLIDEVAMIDALKEGHVAGAALDVFSNEPYQGPLCDEPNVVLTPHVATLTHESRTAMEMEAVKQCLTALMKIY